MQKIKLKFIIIHWLPVFLWCGVIYYLSSVPSLRSDFSDSMDLVLRKFAHITEFAILTALFFRASFERFGKKKALLYAVLFAVTFAFTDEYHQTFVLGRSGNVKDIFIDSLGIFLSMFLIDKKFSDVSIKR
ncbi:MAG: VanZ family protein [Candidatus Pacebacteria bacterium]|nr:VanZ family protein [Candidatus Paceibacterota bacterium]